VAPDRGLGQLLAQPLDLDVEAGVVEPLQVVPPVDPDVIVLAEAPCALVGILHARVLVGARVADRRHEQRPASGP
jgi:hypothetical protein